MSDTPPVAREIGSYGATVRKSLDALAAFKIIEEKVFYNIEELEEAAFQFGTFYTAVDNVEIANFIGTKQDGTPNHPIEKPDVINEENLEELVKWMFERDGPGQHEAR